MTTYTIHITVPDFSFPRIKVGILFLGIVLGISMSGIAYDLTRPHSKLLKLFEKEVVSKLPRYVLLTKDQTEVFKTTLSKISSAETAHRLKIAYSANCGSCSKAAIEISKILNTSSGWQVASMSSQISTSKQAVGIVVRWDEKSEEAAKTAKALTSVLAAAQIPFRQEKAKEDSGDVVLFFGQPGK